MTDDELLAEYASPVGESGMWCIRGSDMPRSRETVVRLVRAQLALGVDVGEFFTADAFIAIVERLLALDQSVWQSRFPLP